jgi:hypothetical protein
MKMFQVLGDAGWHGARLPERMIRFLSPRSSLNVLIILVILESTTFVQGDDKIAEDLDRGHRAH